MRRAIHGTARSTGSELLARVEVLESLCEDLARENARLRASVQTLAGHARDNAAPAEPAAGAGANGTTPVSRRRLLRTAGVAAVGAVTVTALERPDPAAASNGSSVTAGSATTAERRTSVVYDGPSGFNGVVLLGNDNKVFDGSSASYPAGIGGWAGAGTTAGPGGVANGVYGYTDNGNGNGVVGVNSNLVAGSGAGVLGTAAGAGQVGVSGTNTNGTAVKGTSDSTNGSATAILGILTSTAPGSFSAAVRGQNNGTGGLGLGVWGSQAGSGWGGYFTSAGGIGMNAAGGSGTGVNATGATGVTALGETIGVAASATSGRGVVAAGNAAQIQLTPGSAASHPASGSAGDIYVDSTARSWFCRGGTSWVELTGTGTHGRTTFSAASPSPTVTAANTAGSAGLATSSTSGPGLTSSGATAGAEVTGARGIVATGTAAQVQLTPGSQGTHPTSGAAGDIYVDSTSRAWFCSGGSHWVLLTSAGTEGQTTFTAASTTATVTASNSGPGSALDAVATTGRGGTFSGRAAAIRLMASKSAHHPRSGKAGDLFVDSSHRLWFCKRGGAKAHWTQIA